MRSSFTSVLALAGALSSCVHAAGMKHSDRVVQRWARGEQFEQPRVQRRSIEERTESYRYLTNATKPYMVESLPDVNFELGEMYSGNIKINSSEPNNTLFFVWYPTVGEPVDEVTIWLNGGPGCSSLAGFFQENGPFLWQPGTLAPTPNPYSWVNLTNMLWVEQPIGTGFSTGTPTATSETDVADQFLGFFKNFEELFGISNYKIYVTGESYAGRYVPYISAAMLDQNDTTYFDLTGAIVYDPCIGEFVSIQEEYVAVPFVQENNNILNLNDTFMEQLDSLQKSCGYADYLDKYLTFPPPEVQPPLFFNYTEAGNCDVFDLIFQAISDVAPCWDIYNIVDIQCPLLSDVMGFPTQLMNQVYNTSYFNRTDVKEAMHAPLDIDWMICANGVFPLGEGGPQNEGDLSPDPIQHVLPQVIEATNRVLVSNGDLDMIIITNGTLLAIQNMTWNGKLGFQERPSTPINITTYPLEEYSIIDANYGPYNETSAFYTPQGIMGIQHYERGLMWAESFVAGHMQPEFQPRLTYRHMEWLLNRTQTL